MKIIRSLASLVLLLLIFVSCKKNESVLTPLPPNIVQDETSIPPSESTTTSIYGLVRTEDALPESGVVGINFIGYNFPGGIFTTGDAPFDKYATKMRNNSTLGGSLYFSYKTIPVTNSVMNYSYAHTTNARSAGIVANNAGGNFTLHGSSSINFSTGSLYLPPPNQVTNGQYYPDLTSEIYSTHLNPTSDNFALQLPCYAMGDKNQKRWFLKSFGAVNLLLISRNHSSGSNVSFYNGAKGTLSMTIPSGLIASSPDSIEKWVFRNGLWENRGFAKKINNVYVGEIDTVSIWNFASAVKGIYRTIKLRTDSGIALINATVRIKNNATTLAEAQTDADGNALCFLPSNENLTIEVFNRWNLINQQNPIKTITVPSTNNSAVIDIAIGSKLNQVYTFKGNAVNCDGSPITKGFVSLTSYVNYIGVGTLFVPIVNGKYNGAFILNTSDTSSKYVYTMYAKNTVSNVKGADTSVIVKVAVNNIVNLNLCPPQTNLYMNFSLDNGSNYSITGDFSTPYNPMLIGSYNAPATSINGENSTGIGLSFSVNASTIGTYSGIGNSIFINQILYFTVPNGLSRVVFERYDLLTGYIKGTADIYYKDNSNITHRVLANFKVKKP